MMKFDKEEVLQLLNEVKDPEIPVVSVVEMGLIRDVVIDEDEITVQFIPTFSGCPALQVMQSDIKKKLLAAGAGAVEVQVVHHPPWSSDRISETGREKLKTFGLAPPPRHGGDFENVLLSPVACPNCGSLETSSKNSFGPTLCRSIWVCNACRQPFEGFKPI